MEPDDLVPRQPVQERSRRTVRRLLREADRLLPESGIEGFSMIALAERAGVNRATAYHYFPTRYAVFNALAQRYLDDFIELVRADIDPADDDWRTTLARLIAYTSQLYQDQPVARLLFLGGGVTPEIETAHHDLHNRRIADLMRELIEAGAGAPRQVADPDPYLLTVEAVIAVLAVSHRTASEIRHTYTEQATCLATAYLEACHQSEAPT